MASAGKGAFPNRGRFNRRALTKQPGGGALSVIVTDYFFPPVAGGGGVTFTVSRVSAAGSVGTVTATGGALATPGGVIAVGAVGTATVTGGALSSPAGVAAAGEIGTVTAAGGATTLVVGVLASSAVGATVATGSAAVLVPGVGAGGEVGAVAVVVEEPEDMPAGPVRRQRVRQNTFATPSGVVAAGAVGRLVVTGGSSATVFLRPAPPAFARTGDVEVTAIQNPGPEELAALVLLLLAEVGD